MCEGRQNRWGRIVAASSTKTLQSQLEALRARLEASEALAGADMASDAVSGAVGRLEACRVLESWAAMNGWEWVDRRLEDDPGFEVAHTVELAVAGEMRGGVVIDDLTKYGEGAKVPPTIVFVMPEGDW